MLLQVSHAFSAELFSNTHIRLRRSHSRVAPSAEVTERSLLDAKATSTATQSTKSSLSKDPAAPRPAAAAPSFWVDAFVYKSTKVFDKMIVSRNAGGSSTIDLKSEKGQFSAELQRVARAAPALQLQVRSKVVSDPWRFVAPKLNVRPQGARPRGVLTPTTSVSLSPYLDVFACGGPEGFLRVFQHSNGMLFRDLKGIGGVESARAGHAGDVSLCSFFPSGKVLLSGASDMMIKIWAVESSECVATLRGHKGALTESCYLSANGRRFATTSRDGTVRVWDCGRNVPLATFGEEKHPALASSINSCCGVPSGGSTENTSLVCCGGESRRLVLVDVRERPRPSVSARTSTTLPSAINAVAVSGTDIFVGLDDGVMSVLDVRSITRAPVVEWRRNNAAVRRIATLGPGTLAVATAEGACTVYKYASGKFNPYAELVGADCEPLNDFDVRAGKGNVWDVVTAAADGLVREYQSPF